MSDTSQSPSSSPDITDILSSLFSNPDSLSKIGDIISKHTSSESRDNPPQEDVFFNKIPNDTLNNNIDISSLNTEFPTNQNNTQQAFKENPLDFLSLFSSEKFRGLAIKDEQIALLCAIRPYLSDHRREMIDGFIKLGKIAKIFQNIS